MTYTKMTGADEAAADYSPAGLTSVQVEKKLEQFGENTLEREKINCRKIFFGQIFNTLSIILILASVLAFFMKEYSDAVIIMTIVILNASIGFIHEYRAGKAIEKLSDMIERRILTVRDNVQITVNAHYLVPGDVIILHAGDIVPADVKIIEANDLTVSESQLTGESVPVSKDFGGTLYTDSVIESGCCKCIVYATGSKTELGKITAFAKNTKSAENTTRYQKALADFGALILRIIAISVALMFAVKAFGIRSAEDFTNTAIFAIAAVMTAIPEILPMITTVTLAGSALKLAKKKVAVKKLAAIEDLGRINILCADKTGTLTHDRLSVDEIISDDTDFFQKLVYMSIKNSRSKYKTDSTSRAFLQYIPAAIKEEVNGEEVNQANESNAEYNGKYKNKTYFIATGEPEELLAQSCNAAGDIEKYMLLIEKSRASGMKQFAVAYREIAPGNLNNTDNGDNSDNTDDAGKDLIFLGFANLYDPLRSTAKSMISAAKKLGVDVKILSGDSAEAAEYAGRAAGLLRGGDKVCTGNELEGMTDGEFDKALMQYSVFARITPEQKYNIIERLRKNNNTVGYLGDGINDTPALKAADVALAVNNSSDIAKNSASIVLLENNLDVIADGILYGRSVFVNVNKFIRHAVIGKMGNFFAMIFFYAFFSADVPMLGVQLLIGNTIQDLALMSISTDSVSPEEIALPQDISHIKRAVANSVFPGLFTAGCYMLFYIYIRYMQGNADMISNRTALFLFYNLTQIIVIVSARSERSFFWREVKPSGFLTASAILFAGLSVAVTYIPFTANLMGFAPLPLVNFAILSGCAVIYVFLVDLTKTYFSFSVKKEK